jgi:Fic family protein
VATIAEEAVQSARELFEELPLHPVLTITGVVKLVDTTKPTAARAIALLEEVGVLTETTGRRRDRTFSHLKYLDRLRVGTELE